MWRKTKTWRNDSRNEGPGSQMFSWRRSTEGETQVRSCRSSTHGWCAERDSHLPGQSNQEKEPLVAGEWKKKTTGNRRDPPALSEPVGTELHSVRKRPKLQDGTTTHKREMEPVVSTWPGDCILSTQHDSQGVPGKILKYLTCQKTAKCDQLKKMTDFSKRERGREGRQKERETSVCHSTYFCVHWLTHICALTGDGIQNLGMYWDGTLTDQGFFFLFKFLVLFSYFVKVF